MNGISLRRLFDFVAIVVVALVLLGLAWQVEQVASQSPIPRDQASAEAIEQFAASALAASPDLQLQLPLEQIGMELSREVMPGDPGRAVAFLEDRCREVLDQADRWVLSLAITDEERLLLNSIREVPPLAGGAVPGESPHLLFPLSHPTGRVGVRVMDSPPGDTASPVRRLLCWGFILGEGTDAQTVWFARPRVQLSGAESRLPSPAPMGQKQGHAP